MKNILRNFLFIGTLLFSNIAISQTNNPTGDQVISNKDQNEIFDQLNALVKIINLGDGQRAANYISPNHPTLKTEVLAAVRSRILYGLDLSSIKMVEGRKVRIECTYSAKGNGWNISGLSNYFVFEKYNGQWLVSDTDFHKKLNQDHIWKVIGTLSKIFIPIGLVIGLFWFWMLIDCIKNESENKVTWIIMIIFLSILGAILYFFMVKRKRNQI